jgi:transcription termination/antitermination protein NusG
MSDFTGDWWAIQVRPGRERLAATHLTLRGYDVFLPHYLEHRRWSDRVKTIERPLFAGYLFSRLTETMIGKVVSSPAVIRIVGDSRGPRPIPQSEIDAVWRLVETQLAVPWPSIQIGQPVRVEVGPLRNLEGIVVLIKGKRRLVVSIPLLGRSVAVELDSDWVTVPLTACGAGSAAPAVALAAASAAPAAAVGRPLARARRPPRLAPVDEARVGRVRLICAEAFPASYAIESWLGAPTAA